MKKTLLLFTIVFFTTNILAQVTIGSNVKPSQGAILDLKENDNLGANSTKGMALPRVQLTTTSSLEDIGTGLDQDAHIGLTIYVPSSFENSCPGVYVWTGTEWQALNESKLDDFITVNDIDGNTYKAKLFNRSGCKGGVYWMMSNLRTTRKNDGTPFHKPLFFSSGRAAAAEYPFDKNNPQRVHVVKSKSDISTSTDPDKMIKFYHNDQLVEMTQDAFVNKFGLHYTYHMAFPNTKKGETAEDIKICPEGWKVPVLQDWAYLVYDLSGNNKGINRAAPYLFPNTDIYEGYYREGYRDADADLGDDNLVLELGEPSSQFYGKQYTLRYIINNQVRGSSIAYIPTNMVDFDINGVHQNEKRIKSGLNIYPAGNIRGVQQGALITDVNFGATTHFFDTTYGRIGWNTNETYTKTPGSAPGEIIDEITDELITASVRCIKVVDPL